MTQLLSEKPLSEIQTLIMERHRTLQLMDELEMLILRRGWPVPFSPYYLVQHKDLLAILDQLRASLQDEADERFIQAFKNPDFHNHSFKTTIGRSDRH